MQGEVLSTVELIEDPISTFFSLDECPKALSLPIEINKATGEIIREKG